MKTIKELKNGCGKVLSISIDSDNSKEITCDGKILCETCKALIQQQEEILNIVEERFNNLVDNLPRGNNHNFNRNSVVGTIKNEVLIIKKQLIGEEK